MLNNVISAVASVVAPKPTVVELRQKLHKSINDLNELQLAHRAAEDAASAFRIKRRRGEAVKDSEISRHEAAAADAAMEIKACEADKEQLTAELIATERYDRQQELADFNLAEAKRVADIAALRKKVNELLLALAGHSLTFGAEAALARKGMSGKEWAANVAGTIPFMIDAPALAAEVAARFGGPEVAERFNATLQLRAAAKRRHEFLSSVLKADHKPEVKKIFNRSGAPFKLKCPNHACSSKEAWLSADDQHAQCFECRLVFPTPKDFSKRPRQIRVQIQEPKQKPVVQIVKD